MPGRRQAGPSSRCRSAPAAAPSGWTKPTAVSWPIRWPPCARDPTPANPITPPSLFLNPGQPRHAHRPLCPRLNRAPGAPADHRQPAHRLAGLGRRGRACHSRGARLPRRRLQRQPARSTRPRCPARRRARRRRPASGGADTGSSGPQIRLPGPALGGVPSRRLRSRVPAAPDLGRPQRPAFAADPGRDRRIRARRPGRTLPSRQAAAGAQWPLSRRPCAVRLPLRAAPGRRARHLVVDEPEAELVRMLYGWLVEEQTTIRQILKRLNAGPWLPRSGRHAWSPSTVHHILADPIYVGTAYANRYAYVPAAKPRAQRGPHTGEATCRRLRPREQWIAIPVPALVDQETWDRAQAQLARNAALSFRNNARHSYLLRCLLTCEVCGLAMYGVTRPATATKPERQYYECRGKDCVLSARTAACPSRHLKAEEIEPVVWNHVAGLLADPDRLLAQFDHLAATAEAGSTRDQAAEQQLRARLERTIRADKRLLDAYQAGAITLAELSERRQFLASERQALERQQEDQARLRQQRLRAEAVRMDLAAFCNRIHSRLDEATFADKQAILQLVIERIIVGNGRLEIRHVIPLRPPSQPSNNGPVQPIRRLRSDGVNRAALCGHVGPERGERLLEPRRAVDDHELGCPQATGYEIVQDRPPGRLALAAHVFDRQQHLLPIPAHAEHDKQRDRGRLAVKPHPHHRAVEDEADDRLGPQG